MFFITEVFCHSQTSLCHTHTGPRRFVHLSEYQSRLFDNAGIFHFVPQVITLTGTFTDTGENGIAAVFGRNVVDQFLNQDSLTNAGTAEQTDLTALCIRSQQVNDFDTCFQNLDYRTLVAERRSRTVDRPLFFGLDFTGIVDRFAQHVEHSAQCGGTDRHLDAGTGGDDFHILCEALCRGQADAADDAVAHMLCHFHDTGLSAVIDGQCILDHRKLSRECHINDRP